jgi:hypothetical protein
MAGFKLNDDYVDVAERIRQFKELYPDGSLQTIDVEWSAGLVVVKAAAYRKPDDERPGIGMASEPVPGKTPYTRDSELMNAETSAWGRAIVAVGIPTKRVSSKDEVRNRDADREQHQTTRDEQAEQAPPATAAGDACITKAQARRLHEDLLAKGRESSWFLGVLQRKGLGDGEHLTSLPSGEFEHLLAIIAGFDEPAPAAQQAGSAPPAPEATPEPPAPETAADDGLDAESQAFLDETAGNGKPAPQDWGEPRKPGTISPQQLTMLGALCSDLETEGVGREEWRQVMLDEEKVISRRELTKTAATRMIDYIQRWLLDLRTVGEKTR